MCRKYGQRVFLAAVITEWLNIVCKWFEIIGVHKYLFLTILQLSVLVTGSCLVKDHIGGCMNIVNRYLGSFNIH